MLLVLISLIKINKNLRDEVIELHTRCSLIDYNIGLLGINDYYLLKTESGREMKIEEEMQLAAMQTMLNEDAEWLGLEFIPFPRPEEIPTTD